MSFMSSTGQGTDSSAAIGAAQGGLNPGSMQTLLSELQTLLSALQTLLPMTANSQAMYGDATSHNVHGSFVPYVDQSHGAIMSMGHG